MVDVYGKVPPYSGRGRPPTIKRALPGWSYLQVIKQRKNGYVVRTSRRVVYGDEKEVLEFLETIPEETDVVLTGRYAPQELVDRADFVNEVKDIKHLDFMVTTEGIQY